MLLAKTRRTTRYPCLVNEDDDVSRTPETLTAAERAAQLGIGGGPARKVSASQVRALATQAAAQQAAKNALNEPRPANAAADMKPGDEYDGAIMQVPVDKIEMYEKNPRTGENPRYEQIRESIRVQGVTNQLTVTQRPGKDTYVPYGGGNTRLRIVKEFWRETGDERWRTLTVRYRAWPGGDAAIIAAHLSENENRGDTTFWEKAQGVASLRSELEKDSQRVLVAAELNKEMKRLGMDYGLPTIQDFYFAVEWLQPIGKWLQARDVRSSIKPAITSLTTLCERLDQKVAAVKAGIDQCLHLAADAASASGATSLNTDLLVGSLRRAVAELIGSTPEHVCAMLDALSANPNLSGKELRATVTVPQTQPEAPTALADGTQDALPPASATRPAAPAADHRTSPAPAGAAPAQHQQMPLQPAMLAPVRGQAALPEEASPPTDDGALDENDPKQLQQLIFDTLMDIAVAAELEDVVCRLGTMPLGFFVDLPKLLHMCDSKPVTNLLLRKASWHVLAAVSGQYDEEVARRIPAGESTWGKLLQEGRLADTFMLCTTGQVLEGRAHIDTADLLRFFNHPELGQLFVRLWRLALRMQQLVPQRFPPTWQPLSM
jgi:ParB family protein of integrating conjugative element (PFGI_1 class)